MKSILFTFTFAAMLLFCVPSHAAEKPLILILAGQSNMNGQGVAAELPDEMKVMPDNVSLLVDGRPVKPFPVGSFGPEVGIAITLGKRFPKRPIVLFKFAVGGTSQLAWAPEYDAERVKLRDFSFDLNAGPLYAKMMDAWKRAFPDAEAKPDAILWMQGESDAIFPDLGAEYQANISRLITSLRHDLHTPKVPFIIGLINPPKFAASINYKFPAVDQVVAAQRAVAEEMEQVYTVSTDGLGKKPDEVHYNTQGELELGQRFASKTLEVLQP